MVLLDLLMEWSYFSVRTRGTEGIYCSSRKHLYGIGGTGHFRDKRSTKGKPSATFRSNIVFVAFKTSFDMKGPEVKFQGLKIQTCQLIDLLQHNFQFCS